MIREVNVSQLTDVVERLCVEANEHLPSDVKCAIEHCRACEDGEIAQGVLDNIIENYKLRMQRMYRFVRIQVWPVCSWRSDRMYI